MMIATRPSIMRWPRGGASSDKEVDDEGFASVAAGNEISWDDQRRKLELLLETARRVWPA